jgi:hypothetical protein
MVNGIPKLLERSAFQRIDLKVLLLNHRHKMIQTKLFVVHKYFDGILLKRNSYGQHVRELSISKKGIKVLCFEP